MPQDHSVSCLVDAHVHLHPFFPFEIVLKAAARNFAAAAQDLHLGQPVTGVLMLTECAGVNAFARLAEGSLSQWRIEATQERIALRARSPDGALLLIVSGRQIITAEGLEVLALGAHDVFPDGKAIDRTLADVVAAGALAVLPWGFGKWSGRRGAIVKRLAQDQDSVPHLFLGDNGGRSWLFARPRLLGFAERCGRLVLPGSDPLPLSGEAGNVGRFGFVARHPIDSNAPFSALRTWLMAQARSPQCYGRLKRPDVFVRHQIAMNRRKR